MNKIYKKDDWGVLSGFKEDKNGYSYFQHSSQNPVFTFRLFTQNSNIDFETDIIEFRITIYGDFSTKNQPLFIISADKIFAFQLTGVNGLSGTQGLFFQSYFIFLEKLALLIHSNGFSKI